MDAPRQLLVPPPPQVGALAQRSVPRARDVAQDAIKAQPAAAVDIQDKVIQIFEACNFQDLTGQRITKVVSTLRFVEDRIMQMMDIWGGIETFKDIEVEQRDLKEGDRGRRARVATSDVVLARGPHKHGQAAERRREAPATPIKIQT